MHAFQAAAALGCMLWHCKRWCYSWTLACGTQTISMHLPPYWQLPCPTRYRAALPLCMGGGGDGGRGEGLCLGRGGGGLLFGRGGGGGMRRHEMPTMHTG